ncbi:MAG TPA: PA14 domain-containing protein [Planctomycetota bacterium]|nr:PA14 domain-containing protein [Planctomycetota bacterium]
MNTRFALVVAMLAQAVLAAGEALAPNLTGQVLDAEGSFALPGRVAAHKGVLRVEAIGHDVWRTETAPDGGEAHFVIAFKQPMPVGTVLAYGKWRVSYLKPGAAADPTKEEAWVEAAYPGSDSHELRVVPLPPGVATKAVRLSGPMSPDSSGKFRAELVFATTLAGRCVNVAPLADVFVSSSGPRSKGFQPDAQLNDPAVLVNGAVSHRNWSSGERKEPLSPEKPEWIVLDWGAPRAVRGCAAFIGAFQPGFAEILVQRFTGTGRAEGAATEGWETVGRLTTRKPWRPPLFWETYCDFGRTVESRALRFLAVAGTTKELAAGGEGADPTVVSIGELFVFEDLADRPAPERLVKPSAVPEGIVPIAFDMPQGGLATIQVLDDKGNVIENLVSGEIFPKGKNTVWWDLRTLDDYWPPYQRPNHFFHEPSPDAVKTARPGAYRWRGLWHPPLSLHYLFSYYPLKKHGLAWITADSTGGWLADHVPPQTLVRTGDTMWAGTFCEAGHALLEADLDMKKLWGSGRIWLACPRVLAADGDFIYYVEQGGWVKAKIVMIQVNRKTKSSRRLLGRDLAKDEKADIQGLAVAGDRAWLADRAKGVVLVLDLSKNLAARPAGFDWKIAWKLLDHEQMTVVKEIPLEKPGRIRPYDADHLAAVSGSRVVLIHRQTGEAKPAVTGLTNPLGLAVDEAGNFYVGEMDPVHQVKVFSREGKPLRTLGKPGKHRVGAFDPDNLESPAGVEVDARGNVWVCEFNDDLKRTSVWDKAGRCINQVLGPPMYGGGGEIDPADENHFFYRGKEFRRDPKTGEIRLTHLFWRADDDRYDVFGSYPSYPFRRERRSLFRRRSQLFFSSWQGWAHGSNLTLWVYDKDHVRPVGALGTIPDWLRTRFAEGGKDPRFGRKALERVDPKVGFAWDASPGRGVPADGFAVRWTGRVVAPRDGSYRFITTSDDGVRLSIAGKRIIDNWTDHGTTEDAGSIELKAGSHDLLLEFYENSGGATIRLEWEGPGVPRQVIPTEALRASAKPDAPRGLTGAYYEAAAHEEAIFAWTDLSGDGKVQRDEVKFGKIMLGDKVADRAGATWQFRMNENFEVALSDGHYGVAGNAFFRVERLTKEGYPVWRLPTAFHTFEGRHAADAVFTDREGNAISLDQYVTSMAPDGRIRWRYRNLWPGLHAGHDTSALGSEPGVLIAPTRFFGSAWVSREVGEVICLNSNLGATYLFTADGLYIDRVFRDTRRGLSWRMDAPPSDALMNQLSLGDEHFGGTFQRVRSFGVPPSGGLFSSRRESHRFLYVVGQPHCSVVELRGLDRIQRIKGGGLVVTREHFLAAERLRQQRAYTVAQPKRETILRLKGITIDGKADDWPKERFGEGFALGFDPDLSVLYVLFEGKDDRAVFQNAAKADDFLEAFKTGDVVDVMLETRGGLDPKRADAAEGDIRLSFTMVGGKPAAILYDYVVPGTPKEARLPFSSPWRTLYIDRAAILAEAKVAVERKGDRYVLEAAVPLAAIHLDPAKTPTLRGDVGRVLSDQTGTRAVDRVYWANQNTKIMSDVPSEARLQPNLWGTFVFAPPK